MPAGREVKWHGGLWQSANLRQKSGWHAAADAALSEQVSNEQTGMLVAAPERWDEACFTVPAVRALVASGLGVGVLCPQAQREFWQTLDGLAVIDFPPQAKPKRVAAELRGKWQAALGWECGLAVEAFRIAGIARRLGPNEPRLKKFLTHPLPLAVGPLEHRVRHYLAAVEALGVETAKVGYFAPATLNDDPPSASVLLCPDSDFGPSHEWPFVNWLAIGQRLLEKGRQVAVANVAGGRDIGHNLAENLGGSAEVIQIAPHAGAMPLLAAHRLIVAADGSLPHLASHAGATCVVLYGPNDPAWKRPLGKRHAVVRRHVECAPCLLPKCPLDGRCQAELEVGRVWLAILGKLE